MSEGRTSLEMIAPSVREAIDQGLAELGVGEEMVEVEVLDTGSRGLFGVGSRQARVRLTLKDLDTDDIEETAGPAMPMASVMPMPMPTPAPLVSEKPAVPPARTRRGPQSKAQPATQPEPEPDLDVQEAAVDEDELLQAARETVQELLKNMKIRARVAARYAEAEDDQSKAPVWVDISGDDLSILIGPRAETLNALQYIASLIVAKEVGHNVSMIVDVQGFRARRENQIRQIARRMADQAIKTGRRQVLEPMPASERRLVHIELRNNPDVVTESIGEDPRRKVTISPKSA